MVHLDGRYFIFGIIHLVRTQNFPKKLTFFTPYSQELLTDLVYHQKDYKPSITQFT